MFQPFTLRTVYKNLSPPPSPGV
ncbi:hypothetical protein E2C01_079339 [Portunus trituberculatus]|uniref:Uncharacterized protein n=1 Tax=Portunus trituberculatus TaxID=210409 RepID=A0A5B7ISH5_PORTR|nr:hypothetical protein [Portunus trituberculatus]